MDYRILGTGGRTRTLRSRVLGIEPVRPLPVIVLVGLCFFAGLRTMDAQDPANTVSLTVRTGAVRVLEHADSLAFEVPEDGSWSFTWQPGYPRLPVKTVRVLLPPDAVLKSVSVTAMPGRTTELDREEQPDVTQLPGCEVPAATGAPGELWPGSWARVVTAGQFRKYRYALVEVYPFRCELAGGRTMRASSISLTLTFDRDLAGRVPTSLLCDDWLPGALPDFVNAAQFEQEYQPPEEPVLAAQGHVDYLIITTSALASTGELAQFVAHKESLGFTVQVTALEDFILLPGPELADQIRDYLRANYADWGLKYLLLIGTPDPDIPDHGGDTIGTVPMKLCYPQSYWTDKPSDQIEAATDCYFADLTGDWDADGDGYYGEAYSEFWGFTGDLVPGGIDYAAEIIVGRIPFYDHGDMADCLNNVVAYETAADGYDWSQPGALDYRNKVFCITHRLDEQTPSYQFSRYVREKLAEPGGYSIFVAHDEDYGADPPPDLTGYVPDDIAAEWQNGYGVVMWLCHGLHREAEDVFRDNQVWAIPDTAPPIVLQVCCLSGYPEMPDNLGCELLRNHVVGTVCATRSTWYLNGWQRPNQGGMQDIGYLMARELLREHRPLGEVLQNARSRYCLMSAGGQGYHGANLMTFNLYGEPTCTLGILRIGTRALPPGREGQTYSVPLSAVGGRKPYTWSLAAGQLPAGLQLSTSGVLGGVPGSRGIWTFTVQITDASGATDRRELVFCAKKRWNGGACSLAPAGSAAALLPLALLVLLAARRRRKA